MNNASDPYVLIVDDSPDLRETFTEMLNLFDIPSKQAEHGEEALKIARSSPPALILLDLMMPVMDGVTFLKHKEQDEDLRPIPVVVVTARGDVTAEEFPGNVKLAVKKTEMRLVELVSAIKKILEETETAQADQPTKPDGQENNAA